MLGMLVSEMGSEGEDLMGPFLPGSGRHLETESGAMQKATTALPREIGGTE